jgi:hypothetical protein
MLPARPAGNWLSKSGWNGPIGCNPCWAAVPGRRTSCATRCGPTHWPRWGSGRRSGGRCLSREERIKGFLKKSTHSVGVARQYSGTAGRVENCQVGVFVAYASRFGQTLIDRRLYLPEAWANDAPRRRAASVPETVSFQIKPAIAAEMIAAALDAGAACAFVLADALYGADSRIRRMLEARRRPRCWRPDPIIRCAC